MIQLWEPGPLPAGLLQTCELLSQQRQLQIIAGEKGEREETAFWRGERSVTPVFAIKTAGPGEREVRKEGGFGQKESRKG